jgi:hypothetical protein
MRSGGTWTQNLAIVGSITGLGLLLSTLANPVLAKGKMLNLYVSPQGNDQATGQRRTATPGRENGPLATLQGARDAIRSLKRAGKATAGVTVWLTEGTYALPRGVEFSAEDSGTAKAPIIYRGVSRERVRVMGGRELTGFSAVTDPGVLRRLDPAAAPHVVQVGLQAAGIADPGKLKRLGHSLELQPTPLELFFDDRPMELARWPNEGWTRIVSTPAGPQGGRFTYEGDRPKRWANTNDLWIHGYWTWDWADSYEHVARLDTATREIETTPPHGIYGYMPTKRFYFLNVLEELDRPGEYYVDRANGRLYFWPPAPLTSGKVVASVLEQPLLSLKDASYLTFRDLTLEVARGSGVTINGGTKNAVAGCTLRNLGYRAVTIDGGHGHTIRSCDVYDTGQGALSVSGGNRQTLEPSGHVVTNCDLTRFNRWSKTYRPGVQVDGVGVQVTHCAIYDAPHNAILMGGNDHRIEYNEIYRVCQETGDSGAVYMGRNLTMRGNLIQYNYFHDLRAGSLKGETNFTDVMAVYLDDCFCGGTISGNVFERAGRAVLLGGGRDNVVENNLFLDCEPAIHIDARGKSWAAFWFNGKDSYLMDGLKAVPYNKPPYSTRYPTLVNILQEDPAFPRGTRVERNIRVGGKWLDLLDKLTPEQVGVKNNVTEGDPGLTERTSGEIRAKSKSAAKRIGFQPLPTRKMGLVRDQFRKKLPTRESAAPLSKPTP